MGTGACAMVLALYWQYGEVSGWVSASAAGRAGHLTLLIGLGVLVYLLVLYAAGLRRSHLEKGSF